MARRSPRRPGDARPSQRHRRRRERRSRDEAFDSPSHTVVDQTYAFAADITSCDGTVTIATFSVRRKRGPVPDLRPATGGDEYAVYRARSLTVSMEVSLPTSPTPRPDPSATRTRQAGVRVDQPHGPRAVFVHERALRGVRRVRARTPRDASIAHDSSFLSRRRRRAAPAQTHRGIRRRRVLVRDGDSRHRSTNPARDRLARRLGTEEDPKRDVVSPRRVRFVRPGRVHRRGERARTIPIFCALVPDGAAAETETPCPAAIDAVLAEANALGNVSVVDGDRLGGAFRVGDTYRFTATYSVGNVATNASTTVSTVREAIPTVTLATPDPAEVASTDTLRLIGSVERLPGAPDGDITLSWSSDPPVDFARRAFRRADASSLAIRPGSLLPDTVYVFTLGAAREGVAAVGSASTGPSRRGSPTPVACSRRRRGDGARDGVHRRRRRMGRRVRLGTPSGTSRADREERRRWRYPPRRRPRKFAGFAPRERHADGATGDAGFSLRRDTGRRARDENRGTVRVRADARGGETDAATNAMDAAARVGDAEMRAAARHRGGVAQRRPARRPRETTRRLAARGPFASGR